MIAPRDVGGLGIGSIKALNIALLSKWWWKIKTAPTSLWSCIINCIHYRGTPSENIVTQKSIPGVWSNIVRCKNDLRKVNIQVHDVIRRSQNGDRWESDFCKEDFCVAMVRSRIAPILFVMAFSPGLIGCQLKSYASLGVLDWAESHLYWLLLAGM